MEALAAAVLRAATTVPSDLVVLLATTLALVLPVRVGLDAEAAGTEDEFAAAFETTVGEAELLRLVEVLLEGLGDTETKNKNWCKAKS